MVCLFKNTRARRKTHDFFFWLFKNVCVCVFRYYNFVSLSMIVLCVCVSVRLSLFKVEYSLIYLFRAAVFFRVVIAVPVTILLREF